jgi:hypothetical protein
VVGWNSVEVVDAWNIRKKARTLGAEVVNARYRTRATAKLKIGRKRIEPARETDDES